MNTVQSYDVQSAQILIVLCVNLYASLVTFKNYTKDWKIFLCFIILC